MVGAKAEGRGEVMILAWLEVRIIGKVLGPKVKGGGRKSHLVYRIAVEAEVEVGVEKDVLDRTRPPHPHPDQWAPQAAEAATPVTAAVEAAAADPTPQLRHIPRLYPAIVVVEDIHAADDLGTRDEDLAMVRRYGGVDTTVLVAQAFRVAGAETAAVLDVGAGRSPVRRILRVRVLVLIVAVTATNVGVMEGLRKPNIVRSPDPDLVLAVRIIAGTEANKKHLGKRNINMIPETAHNPALALVL